MVDPDVDRLAIVSEDGTFFNEEYTLVACADYILSKRRGNTVSNMSSSRALRDITEYYGGKWYSSAVHTFVQCSDAFTPIMLNSQLQIVKEKYVDDWLKDRMDFAIQPLKELHLNN